MLYINVLYLSLQSSMTKVIDNAYKKYVQSRPAPSSESVKRSKDYNLATLPAHPLFGKLPFLAEALSARQCLRFYFCWCGVMFGVNTGLRNPEKSSEVLEFSYKTWKALEILTGLHLFLVEINALKFLTRFDST